MTRRIQQRILLSFVCALALILIPLSGWAQSTSSGTQQDRTDQNSVDQNQSNPDLNQTQTQSNQDMNKNQSKQPSSDVNSSKGTRQKPDSSATGTNPQDQYQNQNQNPDQNKPSTGSKMNRSTTNRSSSTTTEESSQNPDQNAKDRNLPKTAGELPLIALIGFLAFGAAAGTRLLARVRSSR